MGPVAGRPTEVIFRTAISGNSLRLPAEQPSDDGAKELARRAAAIIEAAGCGSSGLGTRTSPREQASFMSTKWSSSRARQTNAMNVREFGRVIALVACSLVLALAILTGCGGSSGSSSTSPGSSGESSSDRWTAQEVIAHVEEEIPGLTLRFDPQREDAESSVLTSDDDSYGVFSIWVFKDDEVSWDWSVGKDEFPESGQQAWGPYEPYGKLLPNRGSQSLMKTYGENVTLRMIVSAREGQTPKIPGEFVLLDSALSSL